MKPITSNNQDHKKVSVGVWASLIWVLAVACFVATTVGCGMRDAHFAIIPKSLGFLSSNAVNNKVDVLWIIDNSGTMGPEQASLAKSISSFMTSFQNLGFDYHIAVTTTDIRPIDPSAPNDPNKSGQGACFVGNPLIITPSTPNPVTALAATANVGFFGSADAHGLDAVNLALTAPNIGGCNTGFLRSDAFLAVIEFSNADDDTVATEPQLLANLDAIRPPLTTPTGTPIRGYSVSAMVVPTLADPNCVALGPFAEVGTKYIQAATDTNGVVANICSPDFSAGLLQVASKIVENATAVHLPSVPDPTTIQVLENTDWINNDPVNGWTFDTASNSILFHGGAIPQTGWYITINYTPATITL